MTLPEILISLAGLAVIGVMLTSFFVGVTRIDVLHSADNQALMTLREVRQRITRDIREARGFVTAAPASMTLWEDADWDGIQDPGENITWVMDTDGSLIRSDDTGGVIIVLRGLDTDLSEFSYDSSTVEQIRSATITLASEVETDTGGERTLKFEISLRNVS